LIDPVDPRYEVARQLAVEQQALRLQREQMRPLVRQNDAPPPPKPSTIQEISRDGLIGSRRLGRNFEAMLRERPAFVPGESVSEETAQPEQPVAPAPLPVFQPFARGVEPQALLPRSLNERPASLAQDPDSPDLNLSEANRQRALEQGVPASATVRAAAEIFR
jgi:hypothetical protein